MRDASEQRADTGAAAADGGVTRQDGGEIIETDAGARDAATPPPRDGGSGAPVFLSLTTNVTVLRSDQRLVVTAVLTDPDGVDDLIGGVLLDPGGASYGAFSTSAAEGSYQIDLDWQSLNTVSPITAPLAGITRSFRAQFFDAAGNTSERDFDVTLRCASSIHSACAGECVDLQTDQRHCGSCGSAVTITEAHCDGGAPACWETSYEICGSACVSLQTTSSCGSCGHACPSWSGRSISCETGGTCAVEDSFYTRTSCDQICGNRGYSCTSARWWYYQSTGYGSVNAACADTPPASLPADPGSTWESVSCRCVHLDGASTCAAGAENTVAACTDGCSNDGDRWSDCEDFDCCPVVSCPLGTACNP